MTKTLELNEQQLNLLKQMIEVAIIDAKVDKTTNAILNQVLAKIYSND